MIRDRRSWGEALQAAGYGTALFAAPPAPLLAVLYYVTLSLALIAGGRRLCTR